MHRINMKKKRGLKRYFRSLEKSSLKIKKICLKDTYFSYDKIWIDYYGFRSIIKRKPHLDCLIRNFNQIAEQASFAATKFQIWIWVNENNSKDDCIILHSPNPFNSFPHKYENVSEQSNFKNSELLAYLNQHSGFKKLFVSGYIENDNGKLLKENYCILYKENLGELII